MSDEDTAIQDEIEEQEVDNQDDAAKSTAEAEDDPYASLSDAERDVLTTFKGSVPEGMTPQEVIEWAAKGQQAEVQKRKAEEERMWSEREKENQPDIDDDDDEEEPMTRAEFNRRMKEEREKGEARHIGEQHLAQAERLGLNAAQQEATKALVDKWRGENPSASMNQLYDHAVKQLQYNIKSSRHTRSEVDSAVKAASAKKTSSGGGGGGAKAAAMLSKKEEETTGDLPDIDEVERVARKYGM